MTFEEIKKKINIVCSEATQSGTSTEDLYSCLSQTALLYKELYISSIHDAVAIKKQMLQKQFKAQQLQNENSTTNKRSASEYEGIR